MIVLFLLALMQEAPKPVLLSPEQQAAYWKAIAIQQAAQAQMTAAQWRAADAQRVIDSIGCKVLTDQQGNPVEPLQCKAATK